MTTKDSPYAALKEQADRIAATLKNPRTPQMAAARMKPAFKVGIVMDDKVITLEMPWTLIDSTTQPALAEYIVNQMREANHVAH